MIEITNEGKEIGAVMNTSVKETLNSGKIVLNGNSIPAQNEKRKIEVKFIVRAYSPELLQPVGHFPGTVEMWRYVQELSDGEEYTIGKLYGESVKVIASGHSVAIAKCIMEDTTAEPYDGENVIL